MTRTRRATRASALAVPLAALAFVVAPASGASPYRTDGTCDGFPRAPLKTAPGWCVGVVATGLHFPRGVLPLDDGSLVVAEMGGWDENRGRVSLLRLDGGVATRTTLFAPVDRPHGVRRGPDGRVYVAAASRVFRFDPRVAHPAAEDVIGGAAEWPALPSTGRHPLKNVVFDRDGSMLVGVGSSTDHCESTDGGAPPAALPCRDEVDGRALMLRYAARGNGRFAAPQVVARGLRNPLAFTLTRDGSLWLVENGRDAISLADPRLSDARLPHDALDRIVRGRHYGWPYCYDAGRSSPEYPDHDCSGYARPARLLPAHAAPLGVAVSSDDDVRLGRDALLVTYHGYRPTGHRVVAWPVDSRSGVAREATVLIDGWDASATHPLGAPVDIVPAGRGRYFLTEDRNGTVLVLAPG